MAQNPFFSGGSTLDDVAQALGVCSIDLSAYVQQQDMNFMAWVSDQRLRYCAELITATSRKNFHITAS